MNILKPIPDIQEIKIIPRKYIENVQVVISDQLTRVDTEFTASTVIDNGMMVISGSFDLREGAFYTLRVYNTDEVLFTGRIFCTEQADLQNYEMTKNQYTASASTDGIIYI